MTLLLPARVPSSIPPEKWHEPPAPRNGVIGGYSGFELDGPLMRRLTAEFGGHAWRVALRVTGVINRGFKTAKQLDAERWTYDEVATRLQHMKAQPVKPAEIVQLSFLEKAA